MVNITQIPKEVSETTVRLLTKQGWCFWQCSALKDDIITIVRNSPLDEGQQAKLNQHIAILKQRYSNFTNAIYTEDELIATCDSESMHLIHEAKKLGAKLT